MNISVGKALFYYRDPMHAIINYYYYQIGFSMLGNVFFPCVDFVLGFANVFFFLNNNAFPGVRTDLEYKGHMICYLHLQKMRNKSNTSGTEVTVSPI